MSGLLDGTVEALDEIVDECSARGSRAGFFPAMYVGVTRDVRTRVAAGEFDDGERMAQFVHTFAGHYLEAYRAWRDGGPVPVAWAEAFSATTSWRPIVLQHLLLGMNAHINLDLGLTAAELAGSPEALPGLKGDFDEINEVLGALIDPMQRAVGRISPWIRLIDTVGLRSDEAIVHFSLNVARDQAWSVAERMVTLGEASRRTAIDELDADVAAFGRRIRKPGLAASTVLLAVRARETASPGAVIDELRRSVST